MRGRLLTRARGPAAPRRSIAAAILSVVAVGVATGGPQARAFQASQATLVSAVPADYTPSVNDGTVFAIGQVGKKIILGGNFTTVSPADDAGTVYSLPNTFGFNAATGAIDTTGFLPTVDGRVNTVIPGPRRHEVYLGGSFSTVDGSPMRVALLDTRTGALVSTWRPSKLNGAVDKLVLSGGRLFAAGTFDTAGKAVHRGLVALNPTTGKATSYVNLAFTGHHNYGTKCHPAAEVCAPGGTGVRSLDVNPAGTRMVVIGNFIRASGQDRDQVAMIDLGRSKATVDPHWSTLAYTAPCLAKSFDSYIRDVQFSPGGSYFVIVATGGSGRNSDGTKSSCDTAARYNAADRGKNVRPVWLDYTGQDSLWTIAITGTAVYVGGHQRWLNNPHGLNIAGPGAVPRPGIAALSPTTGLPYSWNPGRNPRGAGCFALLATADGLWIGSDTDFIGDHQYLRKKVAFFPLANGEILPPDATPHLPGRVFTVGATAPSAPNPDGFTAREFNGKVAGTPSSVAGGGAWGDARGAFFVDGNLIYGKTDGNLYERSFDGSTFGSEVALTPWDDPAWRNVQTGSGQTYEGMPSSLASDIPSLTSMFFVGGRLYYTLTGDPRLHWRWFEPESGIVDSQVHKVSDHMDYSMVAGAFYANHRLYFARQSSGKLASVAWSTQREASGKPKVVDAATDWASRGLVLLSQSTNPTPKPSAAFTSTCDRHGQCRFHARRWVDPGGGILTYAWKFGDGKSRGPGRSPTVKHSYHANGTHHVILTVMDTAGAKAAAHQVVKIHHH